MDILLGICEVSALVSSLMFYKKNSLQIRKIRSQLEFGSKQSALTPWEICEILKTGFDSIKHKHLLELQEQDLSATFYAIVRGQIFSEKPKKGQLNAQTNLILSKKIEEPIFSNSKTIFPKEQQISEIHKNKFYLETPGFNQRKSMLVYFLDNVDYQNALQVIESNKFINKYSFVTKVLIKLIGVLRLVLQLFRIQSMVRGYKIGHKSTEYGMSINQSIIAFGKVFYDKKTQQLQMVKPECFF